MSEIRVDTISEKTSANGVAIDSLAIKDGKITNLMNATLSAADLGAGLHIKTADTGASVDGNADELVIEGTRSGLSILSANNDFGYILFGDDGSNNIGSIRYGHSANDLRIIVGGSEAQVIHSNGVISATAGIALGVGSANTASNVLDDYEEGVTGVVSIACSTSGSISLQSNFRKLAYTKIGRAVTITGLLKITSVSSPTGAATFALPFALASLGDTAEICRGHGYVVNAANAENGDGGLIIDIQTAGGTTATISKTDNTTNGLRDFDSTFATSQAEISLSFTYFTA